MSGREETRVDYTFKLLNEGQYENDLEKEIYNNSYYEFFKKAYSVLLAGEPYSDNWHIKYLCDILQEELLRIRRGDVRKKDLIINVPFRSAKSLICTKIFPVWCWTIDQSIKFICTSYSADLSLEHAIDARNLMNSEWFQSLYSEKIIFEGDRNASGFYQIKGGGFRKSVGFMGQITGSGADIILCLPAGQKVMTNIGEVDIKDIVESKLNVRILTKNHENNNNEYKKILRYDKNEGKRLIKIITLNNKEIICTEDHEIWTENRGYVKACELTTEDIFLTNY